MDRTRDISQDDPYDPLGDETWSGCESLIRAFELAWRDGPPPAIEDYLRSPETRHEKLLRELIHIDLEFRVKAGNQACVEWYLERYPALQTQPDAVVELIAAEFELRRRVESQLTADEYALRFPVLRSQIARRLIHCEITTVPQQALARPVRTPQSLDVPGYTILAEIGRGGMGVVYQALEATLGRHVALKFVPPELAGDPVLMQRFVREAKTASALNHPHICTVHSLGEHDGLPFIVLEFIEGQTLKSLAKNRLTMLESVRLIRQAAAALAAAHAAGVVHRDIKPENLMVRPDGYVKVVDFGLARRLPTLTPGAAPATQDTWPGALLGTVAYMSPEQARGELLEGASDIFSLGIVLYSLITGKHPFDRGTAIETLNAIANSQPVPMSRIHPSVPTVLEGLIEGMLHKDSRLRPTAAEVERVLATVLRGAKPVKEPPPRRIVHREEELWRLRDALAATEAGNGTVVCVAGEPGIGKTTLVEDFLDEVSSRGSCQVARGRCSERQAAASAYLPVLDALADLLRGETGAAVGRLVRVVAPTWSAQLSLSDQYESPPSPLAFSQQAMLRELATLLAEVSRLGTVVLFIDDVHWADLSTVDLLAYIGRQCHTLPVLIIVTFRPTELLLGPHPFHRVKLELQGQGACSELALGFLGREQIEDYLSLTFPGHAFPPDFADLIHSRTEGSPLFMVDLLRYLRERGVIAEVAGQCTLARELPEIWHDLPETVRSMIQRKLEQLDDDDRRLLCVAAAQGQQFDSTVVAEASEQDAAEVEERLQRLDRVHALVRLLREDEFPDGTPTLRYSFVHVLYQQALYSNLLATRRRNVSKALAEAWERRLGNEPSAFAAELACLYATGRESARAAQQFYLAAQHAVRVFAHRDAVELARRGLALLELLPASPERDTLELPLQTILGLQLQVTEGYAARSAELAYERARQLCASSEEELFPVLWGLWLVRKVRSELPRAQELANELFALAKRLQDPDLALQAHQALGLTALCRGNPGESLRHVEQVAAVYDSERHRLHAFLFGQDPGVICKAYGAVALWLLGFDEAAQKQSDQAIEMSQGLSPTSQSVALHFAAMVFQMCGNEKRTRECAEASATIAAEHGFPFWLAGGTIIGGWALAVGGDVQAGLDRLRHGLREWHATGSVTYMTYFQTLYVDALRAHGDLELAEKVLADAFELVEKTDERTVEAELFRVLGELRLEQFPNAPATISFAESNFRRALEIARQQDAKAWEARAAISLQNLQSKTGPCSMP